MNVYPYRFEPLYKDKAVWGGRALERLYGRELPDGKKIGESWELADLPQGESVVSAGPDAGKTLNALLAEKAEALLGRPAPPDGRFPLLLKLLDANDILSLQVHPDADAVRQLGPPAALKTECWYVVESRNGYILKGCKPGVGKEDFRRALAKGDDAEALLDLVERFDVRSGDFHHLPAGTVHALGAGVVVAEIQTPSDTTYRVSDWGRGREIHVQEALQCIHYEPPGQPDGAAGDVLVRTPFFVVRRAVLPPGRGALQGGSCAAWMVLSGTAEVSGSDGPAALLAAGDTVFLPAGLDEPTVLVNEEMTYLEIMLPG